VTPHFDFFVSLKILKNMKISFFIFEKNSVGAAFAVLARVVKGERTNALRHTKIMQGDERFLFFPSLPFHHSH
jgi:hypothetical protein